MFKIVNCSQCGKEFRWNFEKGSILTYTIIISEVNAPCPTCLHDRINDEEYSFCSLKCLKQYIKKLKD